MREIESYFYSIGITGISILDNWIFVANSNDSALQLKDFLWKFFSQLGLIINDKKSCGLSQSIEWNGHLYNSINGTICLQGKVIDKINNELIISPVFVRFQSIMPKNCVVYYNVINTKFV